MALKFHGVRVYGLCVFYFYLDPVKKRRINWGWAQVPPASTQTMPREVTWHPQLQQLVYSPVDEQANLRGAVMGSIEGKALTANISTSLGAILTLSHTIETPVHAMLTLIHATSGLPPQAGNQSEIRVSFARPSTPTRLSVRVMVDEKTAPKGSELFFEYMSINSTVMSIYGTFLSLCVVINRCFYSA